MITIIYLIGCILSFVISIVFILKNRKSFSREDRFLMFFVGVPFMTLVSYGGLLLMIWTRVEKEEMEDEKKFHISNED